jgi:D-lactate dehydrogenase (cytochrome)
VRDHHAKDESWHSPHRPDAVVFPQSTENVAEAVRICAARGTPVIAYGTGTSLEGNVIPHLGGVVVDLAYMNQVLRVSADDLDVTVQACVTRMQLNEHVRHMGLFFPIDPGANASIGGMAATRAGAH